MTAPAGSGRSAILSAVRTALQNAPAGDTPDTPVVRNYQRNRAVPKPVDVLQARLHDYGVTVAVCAPQEVGAKIADALSKSSATPVLCPPGFPSAWRPVGIDLHEDDGTAVAADVNNYGAGLTGAVLAIAETGTLVLDGGAESGRRLLSLVPDVHVCVVRASDIVPDVPQALAAVQPGRPLTFIAGPSATVDIELVRTVGVHGPRQLHVVVVTEDPEPK